MCYAQDRCRARIWHILDSQGQILAHIRQSRHMAHIRQSRHFGHGFQAPNPETPSCCPLFAQERNTPGREVRQPQARSNRCHHSPRWALGSPSPPPRSIRPQPATPPCPGRQGTPSAPVYRGRVTGVPRSFKTALPFRTTIGP